MQDQVEQWLIRYWKELFATEDIDASSDFFDLGGNSLTAIRFLSRTAQQFGEQALSPEALFENGQLAKLAAQITTSLSEHPHV